MKLEQLSQQLHNGNRHPPVEQWQPPFCGDMDIRIKADGSWFYRGNPIGRQSLVKLLASVLTTAGGEYFLVTPQEKVRIKVDDAPFVVTQWQQQPSALGEVIVFTTNVGDQFPLDAQHPLSHSHSQQHPHSQQQQKAPLYLNIHRQLLASVHRNVYYQLAELAQAKTLAGKSGWYISSSGQDFCLGTD